MDSLIKAGRQLIMSTLDSKTLRELKQDKSYDKLRSITEEESEILMKAKRISFKKFAGKKPKVIKTKGSENIVKMQPSFFTT